MKNLNRCIPFRNCSTEELESKVDEINEQLTLLSGVCTDDIDDNSLTAIGKNLIVIRNCIQNLISERKDNSEQ